MAAIIIPAIALIIAYFLNGPLVDSMREDRPILYVSLGDSESLPQNQLQFDGQNYYVDVVLVNKGKTDGKVILNARGDNAKVSFHKNGEFQENNSYNVIMFANMTSKGFVKVYVSPNADRFSINLISQSQVVANPFQDLTSLLPLALTYQKAGSEYLLIDAM